MAKELTKEQIRYAETMDYAQKYLTARSQRLSSELFEDVLGQPFQTKFNTFEKMGQTPENPKTDEETYAVYLENSLNGGDTNDLAALFSQNRNIADEVYTRQVMWQTGDDDSCKSCNHNDSEIFTIGTLPATHPNCQCGIIAVETVDPDLLEFGADSLAYKALKDLQESYQNIERMQAETGLDLSWMLERCHELAEFIRETERNGGLRAPFADKLPDRLNNVEKYLYSLDPIGAAKMLMTADRAYDLTAQLFEGQVWDDGTSKPGYNVGDNADAFRHAYWNALMTRELGSEKAELWGSAHEYGNPSNFTNKNQLIQSMMDLENNAIGREIYQEVKNQIDKNNGAIADNPYPTPAPNLPPDYDPIRDRLFEKIDNGELIKMDGNELVYTDNMGKKIKERWS